MDSGIFATQIIQSGPLSSTSGIFGKGGLGGIGGLDGVNVDFWNAILGNITEEGTEELKTALANTGEADISSREVIKETTDLALLQLALLGQDPDVNIDEKLAELRIERISNNPKNRIEQLTKLINHLTGGLPVSTDENTSIQELVTRLNQRLENLESSLDAFRSGDFGDEGAPFKLLIATGLNPSQLTKITTRIEEVETKLGRELTVEDLIAGVGNIVPAPGDDDHEFSSTDALGLIIQKTEQEIEIEEKVAEKKFEAETIEEEITQEIIANNDNQEAVVLANGEIASKENLTPEKTIKRGSQDLANLLEMVAAKRAMPEAGLSQTTVTPNNSNVIRSSGIPVPSNIPLELDGNMSNAEFKALFTGTQNAKNTLAQANTSNLGSNATLPNLSSSGDVQLPPTWHETLMSQLNLDSASSFDIYTGTPFNATMNAVHGASLTSQAGQNHPGTQTVAAHISKAAAKGEARAITLQLDPPELGRVEVRMEFGDDKTVKAHLVVEKPETLLMLQRDMSALEKALQDAGLDTEGDAINYGLADDGYNFNGDSDRQDGNGYGGKGSSDEEGEEEFLLETTMTWNVDPETGHVHYNILA